MANAVQTLNDMSKGRAMIAISGGISLLLPWDPEYRDDSDGDGDGFRYGGPDAPAMPADHPLAVGPSRFVRDGAEWKNVFPSNALDTSDASDASDAS